MLATFLLYKFSIFFYFQTGDLFSSLPFSKIKSAYKILLPNSNLYCCFFNKRSYMSYMSTVCLTFPVCLTSPVCLISPVCLTSPVCLISSDSRLLLRRSGLACCCVSARCKQILQICVSCHSALSGLSGLKDNFCLTDMKFSGHGLQHLLI